jgi:hypothetical protein
MLLYTVEGCYGEFIPFYLEGKKLAISRNTGAVLAQIGSPVRVYFSMLGHAIVL